MLIDFLSTTHNIQLMITSQVSRARHPSRVAVTLSSAEGKQSELFADLVVMTDNLATVISAAVYRAIGSLPMTEVDAALRHTLGLGNTST